MQIAAASSLEYRLEARELKSRTELEWARHVVDALGYSTVLVTYAFEAQLKDTGSFPFF